MNCIISKKRKRKPATETGRNRQADTNEISMATLQFYLHVFMSSAGMWAYIKHADEV